MLLPKDSSLLDIHKNLHFYSDMLVVNQSVFLLRDNAVFIYDSFKLRIVSKIFGKQKVVGLYKLKNSTEDELGYKST